MQITKHFNAYELQCQCRKCLTPTEHKGNIFKVCTELEKLRSIFNKPITVTEGYRCKTWNDAIGGAPRSYHLQGKAIDIAMPNEKTAMTYGLHAAMNTKFKGIGIYTGHIHLDLRRKPYIYMGKYK